jgi:hypothetical protein
MNPLSTNSSVKAEDNIRLVSLPSSVKLLIVLVRPAVMLLCVFGEMCVFFPFDFDLTFFVGENIHRGTVIEIVELNFRPGRDYLLAVTLWLYLMRASANFL